MSNGIDDFSSERRPPHQKSKGRLVDLNTGTLRRNHILIQQTPGVELFIGLGPVAGRALDFAFDGVTRADPFLTECDAIDKAREELTEIGDAHLRRLALLETMLHKAGVNDPRPGWPAGAPNSLGGKFRPKDDSAEAKGKTEDAIKRLEARAKFRIEAVAVLKFLISLPGNLLPGGEEVTDLTTLITAGEAAIELGNLETEVNATIEFVKKGPYTLDDLRMSQDDVGFSSVDAFKKISAALEAIIKQFGSAGSGSEYHHIVEQGGDNATNIPAEQLHSTKNMIPLPKMVHELVSAEYSKSYGESGMTVREWLQTQPFDEQWKYGIKTLRELGILKP